MRLEVASIVATVCGWEVARNELRSYYEPGILESR